MMNEDDFIKKLYLASKTKERKGQIRIYSQDKIDDFEKIERKGEGHPDTLSDALATYLSYKYSNYTLKNFGVILHHNFDKIGMMGGKASVSFGEGKIIEPIRVLLNGRASSSFNDEKIPLKDLLTKYVKEFFKEKLPLLDINKDLRILYEVSSGSSPGQVNSNSKNEDKRKYWFKPRSIEDIGYLKKLVSNDTSTGVGYYPYTKGDKIVLSIEKILNSKEYKKDKPWLGSDIKITLTKHKKDVYITICVPQIAKFVKSLEEYKNNLIVVKEKIENIVKKIDPDFNLELAINTRDKYDKIELYLTVTGSSIEMGDEGFVGRGNRGNGLINMNRFYSMEGACGKNPVYHIGFIYTECANRISKSIYDKLGLKNEVSITSQSGRTLIDPKDITILLNNEKFDKNKIEKIIFEELENIPLITKDLIRNKIHLY